MGRVTRSGINWFVLIVLSGVAAYLYVSLFFFPNIPILLGGDQTYHWMEAQRMVYGEWPYLDFFQFVPPGTDLVYFALFKLFGLRIWVTNAVVLALGLAFCWVCYRIALRIMSPWLALLASSLFMTLIYGKLLNATHHWFSLLLIMSAVAIGKWETTPRKVLAAGALLGASCFFTQTHGLVALAAFMTFLSWERYHTQGSWRRYWEFGGLLVGGFAVTLLVLSSYFIATVGFKQLWYFQVSYVVHFRSHGPWIRSFGLPEAPTWRRLPFVAAPLFVYGILPLVYPWALLRCRARQEDGSLRHRQVALLALVGLFLLAEVSFSLEWLRVYTVSMPGVILLVWTIDGLQKARRQLLALVWVGVIILISHQQWSRYHLHRVADQFPAGEAATTPLAHERLRWVMEHTQPGEFFLEASGPSMYLPLQLRNPIFLDGVGPTEATRPELVDLAIRQIEKRQVRFICWNPHLDSSDSPTRPRQDHLAPLRAYLDDNYVPERTFSDSQEIWERNQSTRANHWTR